MSWVRTEEQGQLATSNRTVNEAIATRYFLVIYDALTACAVAESATGVPEYAEILPTDSTLTYPRRVKAITVRAWADQDAIVGTIWQAQVDYSDSLDFMSPFDQPPVITWDFSSANQTYFIDNSSTPKPVVNSAGQPFEQLLERETGTVVVTYKKNVASFDPAQAITYCGDGVHAKAVNSDALTIDGAPLTANQVLMGGMQASEWKLTNGIRYRELTFTLKLRGSWDDTIADTGFNELVSGNLTPIYMTDADPTKPNIPTDKQWPLDGSGVGKDDSSDPPATLTFKPYKPLAFATFGFS